MMLLPILATVLLAVTFFIYVLVWSTLENTNGTAKTMLTLTLLSQLVGIITIWLLYVNI